jgi:hypothetical protein
LAEFFCFAGFYKHDQSCPLRVDSTFLLVPKSLKVKLIAGVLILAKTSVLKWKWWTWAMILQMEKLAPL